MFCILFINDFRPINIVVEAAAYFLLEIGLYLSADNFLNLVTVILILKTAGEGKHECIVRYQLKPVVQSNVTDTSKIQQFPLLSLKSISVGFAMRTNNGSRKTGICLESIG
jgi:hypothetical protein